MVERLVSKTKHLAPTASIMMKEHLNSIVNGEVWSAAKYTTDCLRIERLSHFSSLSLWVSEEIALADIKLRLQSLPGISQESVLALARLMCLSTTCVLESSRSAEHVWDWVAYRRNTPSGSTPLNMNVICIK